MDYLHQELTLGQDDVVEVAIDHPANVMLLDPNDYDAYKNHRPFHYHGGYAKKSPFRLRAPRDGAWHIVIDLGGGPGSVKASIAVRNDLAIE